MIYFHLTSCTFTLLTVVSTLFFDEERDRSGMERNKMLITFNYQITLMEMKTENRDKIMSHDKPVTAAIYNSVFNQVSKKTTTENRDKIMSHEKPVTTAIYNSTTKLPLWL